MMQKYQKIHTRKIDINVYEGAENNIVVEGILKDDRALETHRLNGKILPPGTIHHMIIRIEVKGPQLIIEDIEVEMPTVPHEVCMETLDCLEEVKGLPIVSGFTRKIKALAGGPRGCNHLLALLTAMAPAAVQGAFSLTASKPKDPEDKDLGNIERLKNTCWAWREGGPLIEKINDLSD
jgi:hypothetical protein